MRTETVPGDGNCFYMSFLASSRAWNAWPSPKCLASIDTAMRRTLRASPLLTEQRPLLQRAAYDDPTAHGVVQWLRLVAASQLVRDNLFDFCDKSRDRCIAECAGMGRFADHIFIQALVNAMDMVVSILQSDRRVIEVRPSKKVARTAGYVRVRRYADFEHYDAVVPR